MASSRFHLRPATDDGERRHHITPENAGWGHVGFDLFHIAAGDFVAGGGDARENCLVLISGRAQIRVGTHTYPRVGDRNSPFDGPPAAVYAPAGAEWRAIAEGGPVEIAICSAPGGGNHASRYIAPGSHPRMTRGKGANTRLVTDILPETDPAYALLVVEVITPAGNSSSYPPHKHDMDNLPHESQLEETYYFRSNPPQGFAFQRLYTDARDLDEALVVEDGDVSLVPRGYHPVATVPGYDLYYLNTMAGPRRAWKFHNDPAHEWLLKG